ncbi:hypothetical protein BGX26_012113 [Mortierella sp. AD094]|nr:hypothetical protein BGX26_012113 [Mortierella sp. AD094]
MNSINQPLPFFSQPLSLKVIAIRELADSILCYLSISDICTLRLVSKQYRYSCTFPQWFYKDIPFPSVGLDPRSRYHISGGYWKYVRTLTLDLWQVQSSDDQAYSDAIVRAIAGYPNITGLVYKGVKAIESGGGNRQVRWDLKDEYFQIEKLWLQVTAAATQLKKLELGFVTNASMDTVLQHYFIPKTPTAPLQSLESLTLSGHKFGRLFTLEWGILARFLTFTPKLRELTLDRVNFVISTGLAQEHGNIAAQSPKSLKTLRMTTFVSKSVAWKIIEAFPWLQELHVPSIESFWTKPTHMDLESLEQVGRDMGTKSFYGILWTPFQGLKRLSVTTQMVNDIPLDTKLPPSLVEFDMKGPPDLSQHKLSEMITPETKLRRLRLQQLSHSRLGFIDGFQSQPWSWNLTDLMIDNGLWFLKDILCDNPPESVLGTTEGDGSPVGEQDAILTTKLEDINGESWSCEHFTEQFLFSRIPFAKHLRSLDLGGNAAYVVVAPSSTFLNRLLRSLPKLQDFSMEHTVGDIDDILKGLGREYYNTFGYMEVEGKAATTNPRGENIGGFFDFLEVKTPYSRQSRREEGSSTMASTHGIPVNLNNWPMERPSLRTISITIGQRASIQESEKKIRTRFRSLDCLDIKVSRY